ncbi:hypothetical protein [Microvirga makkahensis]|uniref:hypothetical protein n=1 Tax=Microvirga makkahensis TaxID=1128670 RepID=UPI001478160F|nr:hypothetical protein [Microvirga makkahensis]
MRAAMVDRFFGDEPRRVPAVQLGRLIGTILGLSIYPVFAWIVIDGFLRVL